MYNTIIDKISTKIATINDIKAIYDYEAITYQVYPCVVIVPRNRTSSFKTIGGHNERIYTFIVRVINLIKNNKADQEIVRDIANKLDNLFEKQENLDLDKTINYSQPDMGEFKFIVREAPMYIYEFNFKCSYLFTR